MMENLPYIAASVAAMILLLVLGAFFSAAETAFTSLSTITLRQMQKDGAPRYRIISSLKSNMDFLISSVLIGTNFVNTLNSALATAFAIKILGPEFVSLATAMVLALVIIFVEIIPKTYAAANPREAAQKFALPIFAFQKAMFPVVWLFSKLAEFMLFFDKIFSPKGKPLITQEELRTLIDMGETEGTLEQDERRMLDRIFEFSDLTVHSIMRHRSLVRYISADDSSEKILEAFNQSGYSRIPVYEGNPENIVGVLHYKSVLFADRAALRGAGLAKSCMSPVMFVPETLAAVDLLKKFKKERLNFAVAVNEYGGMAGIVTLDDILHEVFGRITDEHGMVEVSPEKRISVVNVNEFLVPGDMRLDDLQDVLNIRLESEYYDTLGGWLLERFGELPVIGSVFKHNGIVYMVEDQSARRIQTVRVKT